MAKLQKRSFRRPNVVRSVGRGELQIVELGDAAIGRIAYQPGWRWTEDLRPRVGTELCEVQHMGVVLSGVLRIEMRDGSTIDLGPDDAFEIPPGHDAWVIGDEPWVSIDTVGRRNFGTPARQVGRRYLTTILFIDIAGSTEKVNELGDLAWRDLLADHNVRARGSLERHDGVEIGTIGDGLLATFDSPAHGVLAAEDIALGANELRLHVRSGLHTGEVERVGDDIRGIAVHHAARVASEAGIDEILVSSATRVLLGGAGIRTVSVGIRSLKGIEEPDELFRVERTP